MLGHTVGVIDRPAQAMSLLSPIRARILEYLRRPDSATGVSAALGLPRQRVGYHVRALAQQALLTHVGDRRRGNFVERLLVASARHFVIAPSALGRLGARPEDVADRLSGDYLVAVAAQTVREVAALRDVAQLAGQPLATMTLQADIRVASADDERACGEEIADFLAGLSRRYHKPSSPKSRTVRFLVAGYATPRPPGRAAEGGG
jgi:hypothetical protein